MDGVLSVYMIVELVIFPLLDTEDVFPFVINAAISLIGTLIILWFFSVLYYFSLRSISLAIKCYMWTSLLEISITYNLFNISYVNKTRLYIDNFSTYGTLLDCFLCQSLTFCTNCQICRSVVTREIGKGLRQQESLMKEVGFDVGLGNTVGRWTDHSEKGKKAWEENQIIITKV